ncbi:reverse transcriptase domain-containing protein [Tanacetum coccineum]
MQTRSSSKFVGEPSTNPTSTNPKCRNRRRSKQRVEVFTLEEVPVVTMADQRTMAELLHAPTEGYAEAIVVPPIPVEHFDLKHSLINLVTSKQFFDFEKEDPHAHIRYFNKITSTLKYKDVPETSIMLMLFPFSIDEIASAVASAMTSAMTAMFKQHQVTLAPASVKAVEESCVTCGGAHSYRQCPATDGNTFSGYQDNIQGYVSAAAVNYNQGNTGYRPHAEPDVDPLIKLAKVAASAVPTGGSHEADISPSSSIPSDEFAGGSDVPAGATTGPSADPSNKGKSPLLEKDPPVRERTFRQREEDRNEMQATMSNQTNELKNMMASFFQMNTASSSGTGSLPSNTVANPRGDLKAITTRSGISYDGPPIPPPLSPLPKVVEREPKGMVECSALADLGVAEDVFVKVRKFHYPADFVVVDYDADPRVPLILERPFLRTTRALIDVYGEEITLRFNDEAITFKVDSSKSGNPTPSLDPIISTFFPSLTSFEGGDFILEEIKACLTNDSIPPGGNDADFDPEGDLLLLEKLLNDDPSSPLPPKELHFEELKTIKSSIDDPSELELKDLPSHLEYAFLERTDKLPVIISKELKDEEKAALLKVLTSTQTDHRMEDFRHKGIRP